MPAKKQTTTTTVVTRQNSPTKKTSTKSRRSRRGRSSPTNRLSNLVNYYRDRFLLPGMMDLSILPTDDATVRAYPDVRKSIYTAAPTGTSAQVVFVTPTCVDAAAFYEAGVASSATQFGTATPHSVDSYTIPAFQINRYRITGSCISVRYTGSMLNAKGSVIFGYYTCDLSKNFSNQFNESTFDDLRLKNNVICVSTTSIIEDQIDCVSGVPGSANALAFVDQVNGNPNWLMPFVAFTGQASDASFEIICTTTYELQFVNHGPVPAQLFTAPVGRGFMDALRDAIASLGTTNVNLLTESASTIGNSIRKHYPQIMSTFVGLASDYTISSMMRTSRHLGYNMPRHLLG